MAKLPPAAKLPARPQGPMRSLGVIAIVIAVLLTLAISLLIYKALSRPGNPLPAASTEGVPVPSGLPQAPHPNLPQAALPEATPPPPQTPVAETAPGPTPTPPPQPSGTITWWWQLYQVQPSFISQYLGNPLPGYNFVALGITVRNQSNIDVEVSNDNDEFTLNVDNRSYRADVLRAADAIFFNKLPYLVKSTVRPEGRADGFTVYPIPARYGRVTVDWRPRVPATVRVVRVDPQVPVVGNPAPATQVPTQSPLDDQ